MQKALARKRKMFHSFLVSNPHPTPTMNAITEIKAASFAHACKLQSAGVITSAEWKMYVDALHDWLEIKISEKKSCAKA